MPFCVFCRRMRGRQNEFGKKAKLHYQYSVFRPDGADFIRAAEIRAAAAHAVRDRLCDRLSAQAADPVCFDQVEGQPQAGCDHYGAGFLLYDRPAARAAQHQSIYRSGGLSAAAAVFLYLACRAGADEYFRRYREICTQHGCIAGSISGKPVERVCQFTWPDRIHPFGQCNRRFVQSCRIAARPVHQAAADDYFHFFYCAGL